MKTIDIEKDHFLARLEEVAPGISLREITEQSSCVAFVKGRLKTFNEEVFCSTPSGIDKTIEGAVPYDKLLQYLRKVKETHLSMMFTPNSVTLKAKRETIEFPFRQEILIPFDQVEHPDEWRTIPDDFGNAIKLASLSASGDQSQQIANCIHIHPKWIEASDGTQLTRYRIKTGVSMPFLVRKDSINFVDRITLKKIAETEKMLHLKTDTGLIISTRRYLDKYQDMSAALQEKGRPVILPKTLSEAVEVCELITSTDRDNNYVTIELSEDKIVITGESESGRYKNVFKSARYKGPPIKFKIAPKLMIDILKRHTDCEVTENYRIKINGGKFTFMAALKIDNDVKV